MSKKAFDKIADGLNEVLEIARGTKPLKGYRITKSGKVEKIKGYGLDAAARIRQKKSKKAKPIKRVP